MINQQALLLGIASLSKSGIILNKPSSGKKFYTILRSTTKRIIATPPPPPSVPNEFCTAYKDNYVFNIEELKYLNAEVSSLKEFIVVQLYIIKKWKIFVLKSLHLEPTQSRAY